MSFINDLLAELALAFPRSKPQDVNAYRLYARELADLPDGAVEQAVRDMIRTQEFFPTIRALREAAAERILGLPSEATALSQVEQRLAWGRTSDGEPPVVHPLVKEALDHVGGYAAFRTADEPAVIRGQFMRLYREMRLRDVRGIQVDGGKLLGSSKPTRQIAGDPVS